MKKSKKALFSFILLLLLVLFCELAFRLTLWATKKIPFWRPDLAIENRFYPELKLTRYFNITQSNDSLDILILGGSVVADEWRSKVARSLRDTLKVALNTDRIRYFNLANLGHNTADNLFKYKLLTNKRFDLVFFYEAINETKFNNVPSQFFRNDYTHVHWYHDIHMIKQHPELRYTVIPFILHLISDYFAALIGKRYFINESPDAKYYTEGANIKTASIYKNNLESIIEIAHQRNEPLILVNYTYYIPEIWRKSGFKDQKWDFSQCDLSSPISIWGAPLNVEKGIVTHREMMRQLAISHKKAFYFDMDSHFPKNGVYFCDICHLTDNGAKIFANNLASFILTNRVLKKRF